MFKINGDVLLLTDIHFGRKNYRLNIVDDTIKFYKMVIDKYKVKNIIILGDVWHNRTYIDWFIFNKVNEFFRYIKEKDINVTILIGNHDSYYKSTISINSLSYLRDMFNFNIIDEDTEFIINGKKGLLVPWIPEIKFKKDPSKYDIIFGHFEIKGAPLTKGIKSEGGNNKNIFKNTKIISGHYHIKSDMYLGTSEQHDFGDFNEKKGVHILKPNFELEFIENKIAPKYIYLYINSKKELPIRIEGAFTKKQNFKTIEELYKYYNFKNDIIKIILKYDDKLILNTVRVFMNIENIEYIIIDETEELLKNISLEKSIHDDKVDIISIINNKDLDTNTKEIFNELYKVALDKME